MTFAAENQPPVDFSGLEASQQPAWLWQPGSGEILWGNAAAIALWGAASLTELQSFKFDRAMPALAQLQRLQLVLAPNASDTQTFILWLRGESRKLTCWCSKVPFPSSESPFLLQVVAADQAKSGPGHSTNGRGQVAAPDLNGHAMVVAGEPSIASPQANHMRPALAPEDAATLSEIARLIRERSGATASANKPAPDAGAPVRTSTERATPAIGADVLGRLSHELRTPLNAITGFAELLRAELDGPLGSMKYHAYAGHIMESAAHCLSLINDLLDISALAPDKRPLEFTSVDVNDTVTVCLGMLSSLATKAAVGLTYSLDPSLPKAVLDRRSLRQILINLIANAIKATPAGGSIAIETSYRPGSGLLLTISDTGQGMTTDELSRAQGKALSNGSWPAIRLGLGLPLSRELVEANGGRIDIASGPGEGTRVTLQLPMSRLLP